LCVGYATFTSLVGVWLKRSDFSVIHANAVIYERFYMNLLRFLIRRAAKKIGRAS